MNQAPVFYSFRRCPYAIRTRMTLRYCGIEVEHREVLLKDKPAAMLAASPKATVPVLVQPDGCVVDESIDIMAWALAQHDPAGWLNYDEATCAQMHELVDLTETSFKPALDRYKYSYYPPDDPRAEDRNVHRTHCFQFLEELDNRLLRNNWLVSARLSYVDVAVFPFVRQFANVEPNWFAEQPLPHLRRWLTAQLTSALFLDIMQKHKVWRPQSRTS